MIHPLPPHSTTLRRLSVFMAAAAMIVALTLTATPARAADASTAVRAYVTAVYDDLFHRSPDPSGLNTWTSALLSGTPRVAVANSITGSAEYRSRLITESYQQYLNRVPDRAGLHNWLSYLASGRTLQNMEAGFIASPEYYQRGGGTPAGWVTKLYQDVLGRTAGPTEIGFWVNRLSTGASRGSVAMGFLNSDEHLGSVIDGYYRDLLGRTLDSSGRATWVAALQRGTRIESVIGALVSSSEYANAHGGMATAPSANTNVTAPAAPAPSRSGGVGVPAGTPLTVHSGDLVITTDNTVIDGLDVRGFVSVKANNVVIRNTVVRGGPATYPTALVTVSTGSAVIEDSTLTATTASPYINGVNGSNFTLTRVEISNVIDQVHIYGDHVVVQDSWLHANAHFESDPVQGGNPSHDDNIQIQVGNDITITNNTMSDSHSAGVMVTQDRGPVTGLTFTRNHADNGACTVNLAEKTYGPIAATITGNTFGTGQRLDHCAVIAKTTTQDVATITGNTFTDGTAWKVTRG